MKKLLYQIYCLFPKTVRIPFDCCRRKKYWISKKVIFVHVPKAAGTSLSYALYGRSLGHLTANEILKWCPGEFNKFFKFSFVRNPWDRAVSAYFFAIHGSTKYAGIKNQTQYKKYESKGFEYFVYEYLCQNNLDRIDNVFRPQYSFVLDKNNNIIVNFIGKVELFQSHIDYIHSNWGIKIETLRLNNLKRNEPYENFYKNKNLINTVGDLYSRDVSIFRYDFK